MTMTIRVFFLYIELGLNDAVTYLIYKMASKVLHNVHQLSDVSVAVLGIIYVVFSTTALLSACITWKFPSYADGSMEVKNLARVLKPVHIKKTLLSIDLHE